MGYASGYLAGILRRFAEYGNLSFLNLLKKELIVKFLQELQAHTKINAHGIF